MTTLNPVPGVLASGRRSEDSPKHIQEEAASAPSQGPLRERLNTDQPPELSNEVTILNNKLIHAINHQTDLDDTLSETKHQLENAQDRISILERSEQEHKSMVDNRILVKWADVENETLRLRTSLADERKKKAQAENERRSMEQELEALTTTLFEQANEMVSVAKKEAQAGRDVLERRNEQLVSQLKESETLLASQQEQLAELKMAMSNLSAPNDSKTTTLNGLTVPTTPVSNSIDEGSNNVNTGFSTSKKDVPYSTFPTENTNVLGPTFRTDIQAFEDFHCLMDVGRRSGPPSRVNSGNYSSFTGLGLSNLGKSEQSQISSRLPSNGSTSSLVASNAFQSPSGTPNLPASSNNSVSSRDLPTGGTPLKETAFYKRALIEDIEPTLRLDTAPGLSWLARRGVVSSMCDGKFIVEPVPASLAVIYLACSLCGESTRTRRRARTHQFRTNESETAQRYPLCDFCLLRVRSVCDFLGFLRVVKDGHRRIDGFEAETAAWEESVRLRERMFWARIGGGMMSAFPTPETAPPKVSTNEDGSILDEPKAADDASDPKVDQGLLRERKAESNITTTNSNGSPRDGATAVSTGLPRSTPQADVGSESQSTIQDQGSPHFENATTVPNQSPLQYHGGHSSTALQEGVDRGEGSSNSKGSIPVHSTVAKRAALFERQNSQASVSSQLRQSLQTSVGGRSSPGRRDGSSESRDAKR